jgi:hypothetical protein
MSTGWRQIRLAPFMGTGRLAVGSDGAFAWAKRS